MRFVLGVVAATLATACARPANEAESSAELDQGERQPQQVAAAGQAIQWSGRVRWLSWQNALAAAQEQQRPICLVVYADWCARCRELAPVFDDPSIVALSKRVLMVRQNGDERPAWLKQRFGQLGTYVPRVLMLDSQGTLRSELNSGHPRYPYFYAPAVRDRLVQNLKRLADEG